MEEIIEELIDKLIVKFKETLAIALKAEEPDKVFINTFYNIREKLKRLKGTASGFYDIGYLFYKQYILKKLGDSLKITFEPIKKDENNEDLPYSKKYIANYKDKKIILTSNLQYGMPLKMRPDLFLMMEEEGKRIPIVIFEIKIFIHDEDIEQYIINRFQDFKEAFKENCPYFVSIIFFADYRDTFDELMSTFVNIQQNKCFYVCLKDKNPNSTNLSDGKIDGTPIKEIIKKVIASIKSQA